MRFIIMLAYMLPALARAAEVGQFFSANGDTVSVRLTRSGSYHADVETTNGVAACTFSGNMTEVDEGDLRFTENNCSLRILQQDEKVLGVSVSGCSRFCTPGATLRITRARKDHSN